MGFSCSTQMSGLSESSVSEGAAKPSQSRRMAGVTEHNGLSHRLGKHSGLSNGVGNSGVDRSSMGDSAVGGDSGVSD